MACKRAHVHIVPPDLGYDFGLRFPKDELEIQSQRVIPGLMIRTPTRREVL